MSVDLREFEERIERNSLWAKRQREEQFAQNRKDFGWFLVYLFLSALLGAALDIGMFWGAAIALGIFMAAKQTADDQTEEEARQEWMEKYREERGW